MVSIRACNSSWYFSCYCCVIGSISNAILGYKIGMLVQNVISLGLAPFAVLYSVNIYKNLKSIKGSQSSAPSAPVAPATPAAI